MKEAGATRQTQMGNVLALNTGIKQARNYSSAAKLGGSRCKEALDQLRLGLTGEKWIVGGCMIKLGEPTNNGFL